MKINCVIPVHELEIKAAIIQELHIESQGAHGVIAGITSMDHNSINNSIALKKNNVFDLNQLKAQSSINIERDGQMPAFMHIDHPLLDYLSSSSGVSGWLIHDQLAVLTTSTAIEERTVAIVV